MKRFFLGFLTALAIPSLLAALVLLTMPDIRHATFRFAAEVPGIGTYFIIRKHLISRRFKTVNHWLNRQLDLVEWVSPERNLLLPGLIDNAEYSIGRARFPEDFDALRPFLTRLVDYRPDLLVARIWLAQALIETDPMAALAQADAAAKIASADERAYRVAFAAAIKAGASDKLAQWCDRYAKAQFGGPRPYDYNTLFLGTGLQKLALEVIDEAGERQLIGNSGMQLGEKRAYDFPLRNSIPLSALRLHTGTVPGIAITVEGLRLFNKGRQRFLDGRELTFTSLSGFHPDDNTILAVSRDGETVSIHPPAAGFGEADRIVLELSFERLGLASPSVCDRQETGQ